MVLHSLPFYPPPLQRKKNAVSCHFCSLFQARCYFGSSVTEHIVLSRLSGYYHQTRNMTNIHAPQPTTN